MSAEGQNSKNSETLFTRNMRNIRRHLRELKELLPTTTPKFDQICKKLDLVYAKAEENKNTHFALRDKLRANEKEQASFLKGVVTNLATKCDILEAIQNRDEAGDRTVEGFSEMIAAIADKIDTLKEVVTSVATAPPPPPITQPAQPQRPLFSDIAKRTIVLQSIHRNIPAGQVQKDLNAAGIALPVPTVERVRPTRNTVEIMCRDTAAMELAKRTLQTNQKLNRGYNCIPKTVPKHKVIVLAVPLQLDKTYLLNNLIQTYHLKVDAISILTSLRARSPNHNNWVILTEDKGHPAITRVEKIFGVFLWLAGNLSTSSQTPSGNRPGRCSGIYFQFSCLH